MFFWQNIDPLYPGEIKENEEGSQEKGKMGGLLQQKEKIKGIGACNLLSLIPPSFHLEGCVKGAIKEK